MFTARYALSPYIKQIRFVFKGLMIHHEDYKCIVIYILYHFWDLLKFYILTLSFKFLCKEIPDDDRLDRNM
jgi:hypothetical protein